jgi:hypothetical protein
MSDTRDEVYPIWMLRRSVPLLLALAACNGNSALGTLGNGPGTSKDAQPAAGQDAAPSNASFCVPCVMDQECGGTMCVQYSGDSYCAPLCAMGSCAPGLSCKSLQTAAGQSVMACVPDMCSATPDSGTPPVTTGADAGTPPQNNDAGPNGRDGGPTTPPPDAGPIHATVTDLRFAIVGDTPPAIPDDTPGYPKDIINRIWQDIQAENPKPEFAITTGDYMFAINLFGDQANPQIDLYLTARAAFTAPVYYALGNHECNSTTGSNCGPGASMSTNYKAFMQKMMTPLGEPNPYYSVRYDAVDGSWSAKFVIIAGNAWNMDQQNWLTAALQEQTTYTFIVRHEPPGASAPGVGPSEMLIAQQPYTIGIFGHTHTYRHDTKDVVVGIGGAPLSGAMNYGYVLANRRTDGAIEFTAKDYMTGMVFDHFAVKADGTPAN